MTPASAVLVIPDDAILFGRARMLLERAALARVDMVVVPGCAAADVLGLVDAVRRLGGDAGPVAVAPAGADRSSLRKLLRAGAVGIVRADLLDQTLVMTVSAVTAGQLAVPRGLRRHVVSPALSHREKEVLALMAAGLSNRQIGQKLFLAESTIKTHLSSAFDKLDARSRAEATAIILDPDEGQGLGIPLASGMA